MSVTLLDFWKLLRESRLLSPQRLEQMEGAFARSPSAGPADSGRPAAEWLVRQGVLTRYQATLLLNGRAGPFIYGDYVVENRVRGGRLSGLLHAVHRPSGQPVLMKFVNQKVAQDPRQWSNARQYVHAVASVDHPQLQRVFALEERAGYKYLVLERVEGRSLGAHLRQQQRLPPQEACRVVYLAAKGLAELHERRQIFGDVRPWNLWLESGGNVKFLRDSILPPLVPDLTRSDAAELDIPQADYLAPELAHPGTPMSAATDLYALGCTFYQLLTGNVPFPGGSAGSKLERHATERVPSLDRLGLPPKLTSLLSQLLEKSPHLRLHAADEAAEQLSEFVMDGPPQIALPSSPSPPGPGEAIVPHPQTPPPVSPPIIATGPPSLASPSALHESLPADRTADGESAAPSLTRDDHPLATPPINNTPPPAPPVAPFVATGSQATTPRVRRRTPRASRKRALTLSVLAVTLLVLVLVAILGSPMVRRRFFFSDASAGSVPDRTTTARTAAPVDVSSSVEVPGPVRVTDRYEVWEDDGNLLWMTPTSGQIIRLAHVPPGAIGILFLRPHDLVHSAHGPQVLQALGPEFEQVRRRWESACGFPWEQTESLVVSLHDTDPNRPETVCIVTLTERHTEQELLAAWRNPNPVDVGEMHYYRSGDWSYLIPRSADGRQFVAATGRIIEDVIKTGESPPVLRREMAELLRQSDDQRHVSLFFAPDFPDDRLLAAGRSELAGQVRQLRDLGEWLFPERMKAGMISMQFDDPFYLEMRGVGPTSSDSGALADALRSRLRELPDRVESHFQAIYPSAYWRRIALRFPSMMRFLADQLRAGVENDQAVVNVALPGSAAHNLALAGQMLLFESHAVEAVDEPPLATRVPQTLDELLQSRISLSFDQKSLETAMRDLAVDIRETFPGLPFAFEIVIMGSDLQLNGITRNQQISDFQMENQTLGQVLTALVRRANPVANVTDPSEPDQKLVWVAGTHPDDATRQAVRITTRDAARRDNLQLPSEFQSK